MCNCINDKLEKTKVRIIQELPECADKSTFRASFLNEVPRFNSKKPDVSLVVGYQYYKNKNDGARYKQITKGTVNLAMSYCPFCGEKYV